METQTLLTNEEFGQLTKPSQIILDVRQKPTRRRKGSSAPPGGPRQRDPQDPVFQLLAYIGTISAGFIVSQHSLWGSLAVFIIAMIALLLCHKDW